MNGPRFDLDPHDHELDGKLHDECPMCEEIRGRLPGADRDRAAASALERYRALAEHAPRRRRRTDGPSGL